MPPDVLDHNRNSSHWTKAISSKSPRPISLTVILTSTVKPQRPVDLIWLHALQHYKTQVVTPHSTISKVCEPELPQCRLFPTCQLGDSLVHSILTNLSATIASRVSVLQSALNVLSMVNIRVTKFKQFDEPILNFYKILKTYFTL